MRTNRFMLCAGLLGGALMLAAATIPAATMPAAAESAGERKAVLVTYADIAGAIYADSLLTARTLQEAGRRMAVGQPRAARTIVVASPHRSAGGLAP